jgi:hypothetical protein
LPLGELHNLYTSSNTVRLIKKDGMGGACSALGEMRNVYTILTVKPEGKGPHEIPRRRW